MTIHRKIAELIERKGSLSARELTQCSRLFYCQSERAEMCLNGMAEDGILEAYSYMAPGGGWFATRYRLRPDGMERVDLHFPEYKQVVNHALPE